MTAPTSPSPQQPTPQYLEERAKERRILDWEGRLIIQLDRLAGVQKQLTKQLVVGRTSSEVVGAYMDLRNIATMIESFAKDVP